MNKVVILCVEDESEVRDAIQRDLAPFAGTFRIECSEDVDDARSVIGEAEDAGDRVGLILCDHMLPGKNGVEFLVDLHREPAHRPIRKVLITGQAGHEDTIKAINEADLQHYIAKPWSPEDLQAVVRKQLTDYVLAEEENLLPYVSILDGNRLMEAISHRRSDT